MTELVEIVRLGHAGDGVTADGAFVPYTLPGDVVRVAREGNRVAVVERVSDGPSRVAPPCPHFGVCGGCALQHVARETYLEWKRQLVVDALSQRGFENVRVDPIIAVPPGTRRRASFKVKRGQGTVQIGFYERDSHSIVDVRVCPLLVPPLQNLLPRLHTAMGRVLREGEAAEAHATWIGGAADVSLKLKRARDVGVLGDLAALAADLSLARLTWNGELVALSDPPSLVFGRFAVALPPEAFLQPTEEGERILQSLVAEGVAGVTKVADLFSGCGTLALAIAEGRAVHAVESDAAMAGALAAGARGERLTVETRDLFRRPLMPAELARFDAVVLDPPRPGASTQAKALATSSVRRVVYVSCNPASFARDARVLADSGYALTRVQPVDQFVWSAHTELVGYFERSR